MKIRYEVRKDALERISDWLLRNSKISRRLSDIDVMSMLTPRKAVLIERRDSWSSMWLLTGGTDEYCQLSVEGHRAYSNPRSEQRKKYPT